MSTVVLADIVVTQQRRSSSFCFVLIFGENKWDIIDGSLVVPKWAQSGSRARQTGDEEKPKSHGT